MTGYVSPAALPRHVLDRADTRDALARRDFGRVFALAHKWAGISYLKIADACDIKPERVGKLAKGCGSITSYDKIATIADGMRIPGELVGLAPRSWEAVAERNDIATGGDDVQRRQFLAATLAVGLFPKASTEFAIGRKIDAHTIERIRLRTQRLRRLDDVLGGGDTFQLFYSEFKSTAQLAKDASYTESTGRQLLSLIAEQAQQAGWAAFDAGDNARATKLYKRALSASTEAKDAPLAANSLAFLAYQQAGTNVPAAVEYATASCAEAGANTPAAVGALLYGRLAWAHAKAGNAVDTERALEQAQSALSDGASGEQQPDWAAWVDSQELQIMSGRCWTELRRPLRAVPALETALAGFDDSHARDKALYMSWLANAYLDAQEVEQSVAVINRAADLAAGVASIRPQQRIATFMTRLEPHRALPVVAETLERAAA